MAILYVLRRGGSPEEPPHLIDGLKAVLGDFGMLDGAKFVFSNRLAGFDLDAAGLHRLRQLTFQFNLEQAILE
jgi:hypothetical protein